MRQWQQRVRRWAAAWASAALRGVAALAAVGAVSAGWVFYQPVWAALRTHPYFAVKNVVIRGAGPLLTRDDVLAWLGMSDGASVWDLSPAQVRARLEVHPLIARATVRREFPDRFEIEVRERRPEAIAVLDALYYLDRDGRVIQALGAEHDRDYPMITGLSADADPNYRTWALRRALRLVRLCQRMACPGGVSEIRLHPQLGVVLYPRGPRVPVVLGWGSWREKLTRAARVLAAWETQTERLARVDVRFRDQVLVKLRTPPGAAPRAKTKSGTRA